MSVTVPLSIWDKQLSVSQNTKTFNTFVQPEFKDETQ